MRKEPHFIPYFQDTGTYKQKVTTAAAAVIMVIMLLVSDSLAIPIGARAGLTPVCSGHLDPPSHGTRGDGGAGLGGRGEPGQPPAASCSAKLSRSLIAARSFCVRLVAVADLVDLLLIVEASLRQDMAVVAALAALAALAIVSRREKPA